MRNRTLHIMAAALVPTVLMLGGCAPKKQPVAKLQPSQMTVDTLALGNPALKNSYVNVNVNQIIDAASGEPVSFDAMIDRLLEAKVVYLGESHTSYGIHRFQDRVIRALHARKARLKIGMEFFYRDNKAVLDDWTAGRIDEEQLLRGTGWYMGGGYHFGYYRPFITFAQEERIPVVGLNIPRTILRAVSTKGLDSLAPEQKAEVGAVDVSNPEHRRLIEFYFGGADMGHGGGNEAEAKARLDRMYAAQCTWDQVFADSAIRALKDTDAMMVVIVGSGHVAYDLGTNRRLREISGWKTATVMPVHVDKDAGPATAVRSLGDFIVGFEQDMDPEYYPNFGVSAADRDGKIVVGMLMPGNTALKAGLAMGDVITALDDQPLKDVTDLRIRLSKKNWGDSAMLTVKRGESEMKITITPVK